MEPQIVVKAAAKLAAFLDSDEGQSALDYMEKALAAQDPNAQSPTAKPGNNPIHGNAPEIEQVERKLVDLYNKDVFAKPLGPKETKQMRVAALMDQNGEYRDLVRRSVELTTRGRNVQKSYAESIVAKMDAEGAEQLIEKNAAGFASRQGVTVEAARIQLRKAYRAAAAERWGTE